MKMLNWIRYNTNSRDISGEDNFEAKKNQPEGLVWPDDDAEPCPANDDLRPTGGPGKKSNSEQNWQISSIKQEISGDILLEKKDKSL